MVSLAIFALFVIFNAHFIYGNSDDAGETTIFKPPCTSGPLGMENGEIPDSSITASSAFHVDYQAEKARLNVGTVGWIPQDEENQWIQVDLGDYTAVTGVIVQGYSTRQYVKTFSVQYSNTGQLGNWTNLTDDDGMIIELTGNTGSGMPEKVAFPVVLMTRFIRILPLTWSEATPYALRFEVLGCRDAVVRLAGGDVVSSGRVEIYRHGSWGAVCDSDWDIQDATTVCRQLGFSLGALEATMCSMFGQSGLPIVMSRVSCTGTEKRLADCSFICADHAGCDACTEAGVVCRPNTIRVVGGSSPTNGRIEIYRNDTWGTICDTDWDISDADVACRQLGYDGAVEAKSGAYFGEGRGPVYMDGLACNGTESKITDCPSLCWEETKCNHTQDAGVVCSKKKLDVGISNSSFMC